MLKLFEFNTENEFIHIINEIINLIFYENRINNLNKIKNTD